MTEKEVKVKLESIRHLRNEIRARERQLEELQAQATHITSVISYSKTFGSERSSQPENYAVNSYELVQDLDDKVGELYELMDEGMRMIDCLSDPLLRAMLIDYHINGLKMEAMTRQYHYSWRQIYNLRWVAYRKIATNFH